MIDRLFQLRARGTDLRTEVVGGASTFAALSYIVFVQPAVLATTGMEPGAVLAATCLASAFDRAHGPMGQLPDRGGARDGP